MLPKLPREFLWTDKEKISEFFELDDINIAFYDLLDEIENAPQLGRIDEVNLFNEVYYQATRMVYEHPMPNDLQKYVVDIKANLGWNYGAELVLTMVYHLFFLIKAAERPVNKFYVSVIREKYYNCVYWKPFKHCFERLKKEKRYLKYNFKPCPISPAEKLDKYIIFWDVITQNYELSSIEHLLTLWQDNSDRLKVAKMVEDNMKVKIRTGDYELKKEQVHRFFLSYFSGTEHKIKAEKTLKLTIEEKDKEIANLRSRVGFLESTNNALRMSIDTLIPDERDNTRTFTLMEIVDYCKNKAEWNDVKDIVAMLNKLVRTDVTDEECEMIDSIEKWHINKQKGNNFYAPVGQIMQHVDKVENQNKINFHG